MRGATGLGARQGGHLVSRLAPRLPASRDQSHAEDGQCDTQEKGAHVCGAVADYSGRLRRRSSSARRARYSSSSWAFGSMNGSGIGAAFRAERLDP
jgi:hypothetical protein